MMRGSTAQLKSLLRNRVAAEAARIFFALDPGLTTRADFIPPLCGWFDCQSAAFCSTEFFRGEFRNTL